MGERGGEVTERPIKMRHHVELRNRVKSRGGSPPTKLGVRVPAIPVSDFLEEQPMRILRLRTVLYQQNLENDTSL